MSLEGMSHRRMYRTELPGSANDAVLHRLYESVPAAACCYGASSTGWTWNSFISELKYRCLIQNATLTSPMSAGTSISGPTTPTKASPDFNPKTATATAIANSKLLPAAVKDSVADCA